MKHRKPSRAQRAMASSSLPLATAAAVATLFAAPAGAVPDQPTTPSTPAPAQPGTDQPGAEQPTDQNQPQTTQQQPGSPGTAPTPSQPGVTTPDPDQVMPEQKDPKLSVPTQPGVTTPRVAPLPVPGQPDLADPAVMLDPAPGEDAESAQPGAAAPGTDQPAATPDRNSNTAPAQPEADTLVQQPRWEAPRQQAAPAAPVVAMEGPHVEVGANVNGGGLLPGFVANTHHFNNAAGYVGTIGYRTPTGTGEAGVAVEYLGPNTVKVSTYTGGEGLADNTSDMILDTTEVNAAKAAVEHWIAAQPGGAAALEAAAQVRLPIPPGEMAPQTAEVAGVTTQWGGSLQY